MGAGVKSSEQSLPGLSRKRLDPGWLQILFETVNEGLVVVGPDFKIEHVNKQLCEMTGVTAEELICQPVSRFYCTGKPAELPDRQWCARMAGQKTRFEFSMTRKDGSGIIAMVSVAPIIDENGHFQGSISVFTDVTEQRRMEQEQDHAHAVFEQVFNTAAGGMRLVDSDFRMILVNQAFLEMTGLSRDEALGMKCHEAFADSHCHSPACPLTRILAGEDRIECEVEKRHSRGGEISCLLTATPYRDPDGTLIGIVEDFRDVSDLKLAKQNLDLRARKLDIQQTLVFEKEAALRQVLQQIEADKRRLEKLILSNIDKIVVPLLRNARDKADDSLRQHLKLIEDSLHDIKSPLVDEQDQRFASLTPRETEICNMIKEGLRSKEIARIFSTSEGTVEQQRKQIRRKLGLKGSTRNLTSYLKTS